MAKKSTAKSLIFLNILMVKTFKTLFNFKIRGKKI
ncbi:hypothetical protein C8C83_0342 [Flavobacterium sp. 90]|nr:hypothetical protein C8C82_0637 [Flavobacterium sp. 81]TCK52542.1 hypothetical protein C8C83_0342 [Flavobacterium sp. 90]